MRTPAAANVPAQIRRPAIRFAIVASFCLPAFSLMVTSSVAAPAEAPATALTRYTYTQYHMGVDARLVVYAPNLESAERSCIAAFARIGALDSIMSDYRRDSELNRLCARAGGPPVKVSPELFLVLERAQKMSEQSGGAFDVTVGPVIALWRQARKSAVLPDPQALAAARKLVGWKKVRLDPKQRTVQLTTRGMKLDLGGIAKGYAADEAQRVLQKEGITSALVEMGGDIVVTAAPPGTEGWTIRVPNAGDDRGPKDLKLTDCAISTSGDTVQFVEIGGKRYSHVIDPRTGQALTNRVQVSVIAPDGLTSDPLTKALGVVGDGSNDKLLMAYPGTRAFVKVLAN